MANAVYGVEAVVPYLVVNRLQPFVEFVEDVFGGVVDFSIRLPNEVLAFVEMTIGESSVPLARAEKWLPARGSMVRVRTNQVDYIHEQGVSHGGVSFLNPGSRFDDSRTAGFKGPFGNFWWLEHQLGDVDIAEVENRYRQGRSEVSELFHSAQQYRGTQSDRESGGTSIRQLIGHVNDCSDLPTAVRAGIVAMLNTAGAKD